MCAAKSIDTIVFDTTEVKEVGVISIFSLQRHWICCHSLKAASDTPDSRFVIQRKRSAIPLFDVS